MTDKQHVNRVIIIGGQNDANKMLNDNVSLTSIDNSINTLLNTIHTEAPNAIIDIFPMCLAMGESMNRQNPKWAVAPDYRQQVYNLFATKRDIPNVVFHEGAYRAGVWASRAADGGDDGDGAHLSKGGYSAVGHAMGSCILHGTTFSQPKAVSLTTHKLTEHGIIYQYLKPTVYYQSNTTSNAPPHKRTAIDYSKSPNSSA